MLPTDASSKNKSLADACRLFLCRLVGDAPFVSHREETYAVCWPKWRATFRSAVRVSKYRMCASVDQTGMRCCTPIEGSSLTCVFKKSTRMERAWSEIRSGHARTHRRVRAHASTAMSSLPSAEARSILLYRARIW